MVRRHPLTAFSTQDGHHECRAAATAARKCGERGGSPGSARGRPSICTSVTVIGLYLAALIRE
eukprot:scaffold18684_cov121-Isochrysis_galbana.AAC.3